MHIGIWYPWNKKEVINLYTYSIIRTPHRELGELEN
jgi:hypothetical protein